MPDKLPKEKKKFNRLLLLALWFVSLFAVYEVGVHYEFKPVIHIYCAALCILAIAFVAVNRGTSVKPPLPDELPDEWDHIKKQEYIDAAKARAEKAKLLLYPFLSILLTLLFDWIYLMLFSD